MSVENPSFGDEQTETPGQEETTEQKDMSDQLKIISEEQPNKETVSDRVLREMREKKRAKMTPEELAADDKIREQTEATEDFFKGGKSRKGEKKPEGKRDASQEGEEKSQKRLEKLKVDHDAYVTRMQGIRGKLGKGEPITDEDRKLLKRPATKLFRDLMGDK